MLLLLCCLLNLTVLYSLNLPSNQNTNHNKIISLQQKQSLQTNNIFTKILPIIPLLLLNPLSAIAASKGKLEYQPALQGLDYGKPRTYYPDYTQVEGSGLQYKAVKEGTGYNLYSHITLIYNNKLLIDICTLYIVLYSIYVYCYV